MAAGVRWLTGEAARLYGWGWEMRRRAYAAGWRRPRVVAARVVSVGNLTVGGTGKTTLVLDLARRLLAVGRNLAVVCRDYRPGPAGRGDEALLLGEAVGAERVFSGRSKREQAGRAAALGHDPILVDDGFSHWGLERDLDLVLVDARDPWGGGALLPAGRLREPKRALQRADIVVISRVESEGAAPDLLAEVRRLAPAALIAAGRHRVTGVRHPTAAVAGGPARVVTGTGNPQAVAASAREAGYDPVVLSAYRDHHWFSAREAGREFDAARAAGATLLVTAKDAVRWPSPPLPAVLEVEWHWVLGGDAVMARLVERVSQAEAKR